MDSLVTLSLLKYSISRSTKCDINRILKALSEVDIDNNLINLFLRDQCINHKKSIQLSNGKIIYCESCYTQFYMRVYESFVRKCETCESIVCRDCMHMCYYGACSKSTTCMRCNDNPLFIEAEYVCSRDCYLKFVDEGDHLF